MSRHVSEDENVDASENEEEENANNSSVEEDNDDNDDGNDHNDDSNNDDDNDGNDIDGDDNDDNEDTKKVTNKSKSQNKKGRSSRAGRARGGRGHKARDNRYRVYIFKILQQVHPKIGITKTGMDILNSFVEDMFEKICNEAMKLCSFNKTSTISAREISTAAKLILPGELRKHAVIEGEKAVRTYQRQLKDLKEKRLAHRGDKKGVFPGKRKKNEKNTSNTNEEEDE